MNASSHPALLLATHLRSFGAKRRLPRAMLCSTSTLQFILILVQHRCFSLKMKCGRPTASRWLLAPGHVSGSKAANIPNSPLHRTT